MTLRYEPASEPLHIYVKNFLFNQVAEAHYKRALEIDPRNVFALCSLAGI